VRVDVDRLAPPLPLPDPVPDPLPDPLPLPLPSSSPPSSSRSIGPQAINARTATTETTSPVFLIARDDTAREVKRGSAM
jgi:hypothetical protein